MSHHPVSKVSQFPAITTIEDEDLLYVSQKDAGPDPYISKHISGLDLKAQHDDRYILKTDVFLNLSLPALIIRK